jgi:GNAT superfamily N-acetyltransferase
MVIIEQVNALTDGEIADLAEIMIGVVAEGYSIGYLTPPSMEVATRYWRDVLAPNVRLLLARSDGRVVGTAQLELATRENGLHRAEVNKVLVHPDHHGQGIGKRLMAEIEALARREGRTLLYLDTNENDPANEFYGRTGWKKAGTIPHWAGSPRDGQVHGTTFYFKLLDE